MGEKTPAEREDARRRLAQTVAELRRAEIGEDEMLEALGVSRSERPTSPRADGARARASASTRTA